MFSWLCWLGALIMQLLAAAFFVMSFTGAASAPQEAAIAAVTLCLSVVPYCFARAVSELGRGMRKSPPPPAS